MSRRTALFVTAAAVVVGIGSEHLRQVWLQPVWLPILDLLIGWLLVACGLIAAVARPGQSAGRWLVVAGFLWMVGSPRQWFIDRGRTQDYLFLDDLNFVLIGWADVILAAIALTYPGRRPERRRDAMVIAALAVVFFVQSLVRIAFRVPDFTGADLLDFNIARDLVAVADIARSCALAIAGILVVQRWFALSGPGRRVVGPVLIAGVVSCAVPLYTVWYPLSQFGFVDPISQDVAVPTFWVLNAVRVLVPISMLVGILRQQHARGALADAMASVGSRPSASTLEAALRRALGDPSLRVLRWDDTGGVFVDAESRVTPLPAVGGRAMATVVQGATAPLAAIVHDRALAEDPTLIEAGAAVTRLVVDNERLTNELRRQLEAVRASRERIVDAGDAERRRIERDLHDGVQQRLLAMALALRRVAGDAGSDRVTALNRGADEALGVVDDVRELARGIHPAVLTEGGLSVALQALADRSPVPVTIELGLDGEVAPRSAVTAYFVASEALTNVAKHADATSVWLRASRVDGQIDIVVEDDGRGHADPRGTGLGGLDDRLAAIGGTLEVSDRPAGGTVVRASIPAR